MTPEMLEKMGVLSPSTKNRILEAFAELESRLAQLEEEKNDLTAELEETRKKSAVEKAILEAGGRNAKAILALVDLDKVVFDEKTGLEGLHMEQIKAEAPYLFYEKEEKMQGTGMTRGQKKKENEISAAFKKGLRR